MSSKAQALEKVFRQTQFLLKQHKIKEKQWQYERNMLLERILLLEEHFSQKG